MDEARKRLNDLRRRRIEVEACREKAVKALNFVLAMSFRQELEWIDFGMDYLAEQLSETQEEAR